MFFTTDWRAEVRVWFTKAAVYKYPDFHAAHSPDCFKTNKIINDKKILGTWEQLKIYKTYYKGHIVNEHLPDFFSLLQKYRSYHKYFTPHIILKLIYCVYIFNPKPAFNIRQDKATYLKMITFKVETVPTMTKF